MLTESVKYSILERKLSRYNNEVLNEQFFKKLGQGLSAMGSAVGRGLVPGYKGHGGATTSELEKDIPEMKALEAGLKNVKAKEDALKGMKIGNVDALDGALDQYVTALVDLYGEFKDVVDNKEKRMALPGVFEKLQSSFKTARSTLRQLQQAVADANTKVSQALKGSELEQTTVSASSKKGVAYDAEAGPAAQRRGDIPDRARGPLTTGGALRGAGPTAGGLAGGRLEENKVTKKLPSLKEVCKLD